MKTYNTSDMEFKICLSHPVYRVKMNEMAFGNLPKMIHEES